MRCLGGGRTELSNSLFTMLNNDEPGWTNETDEEMDGNEEEDGHCRHGCYGDTGQCP